MTTKELIAHLETFDPEAEVYVDNTEWGPLKLISVDWMEREHPFFDKPHEYCPRNKWESELLTGVLIS